MKYKFLLLSVYLISISNAFAEEAEAHHESSIMDLKYPVLNFVIFAGFIIWKMKGPLAEMFNKKSEDVKSLLESAAKQSKDANEKLQNLEAKIKNIDSELVKITADYNNDVVSFAKNQNDETATTIARMKKDRENKLLGEKKELLDQLNHEVLNLVINDTQSTIQKNKDLKASATNKIMMGLK